MSKLTMISTSLLGLILACSSAPAPQPETPAAPPPSAATPAPPEPEPEAAATAEPPPPAPTEPAAEPPPPAESKPSSSPKAVLTATEVAFVIDYANSDASDAAEATCSKSAAEDAAKLAACKTKARDEFLADVIKFKKEGTKWSWYVYKRKGSNLTEVFSAPVEFAEETERTVAVQIKGGDGTRPLFKGANKFVVTVPNDYSIELKDPKYGSLLYDAKIGMVGH